MKTSSLLCCAALAGLSLFSSGCVTMKPRESGALLDYNQLSAADERGTRVFRSDSHQGRGAAVWVAPVEISPEGATDAGLDAEQLSALRTALDEELRAALGAAGLRVSTVPVVHAGGAARGIRVRAVVTAVNGSNPALNTVSVLAVGLPADPGGVAVELEARDAAGALVAARAEGRGGRPYQIFSGLKRTGHAKAGFRKIADAFAAELVAATGQVGAVGSVKAGK
jgi:hypothetical protein